MNEQLIDLEEYCRQSKIDITFVRSLQDFDLIEISAVEERRFIPASQLNTLEKCVQLHYELSINLEGIDVITQLLQRISTLQTELTALKNRLSFYEK